MVNLCISCFFCFSSRRRHTRCYRDWSSDVCSSDLSTGRLSLDGMMPLAPSMDCPGPIASTAGDLAALYGIMSGGRAVVEVPAPEDGSPGLRVGMPGGFFAALVHPDT